MTEAPARELHIFLVAGEESGDRIGAALMRSLKAKTAGCIRFSGVGGDQMAKEGLASLFPLETTAVIGFSQIPGRLRTYWRHIRDTAAAAVASRPDVLVIVDSPEFTHRVARRVRQRAPLIPIVNYVSPTVWAWRPGRARAMRRYVDHVLAVLPFEPATMARLGGPPCTYVGHPLSERISALRPSEDEARIRDSGPPTILIMPGSRRGELNRMLDLFRQTTEALGEQVRAATFVMPSVPALADTLKSAVTQWRVPVRVVSAQSERDAAFRTARLALAKSGTSTLELAIAGVPMVACYRGSWLEAYVARKVLTISSVILPNLLLAEHVVPEFMQEQFTAENVVVAALPLLKDSPQRQRQVDAFKRLDAILEFDKAVPSERAAEIVLGYARR